MGYLSSFAYLENWRDDSWNIFLCFVLVTAINFCVKNIVLSFGSSLWSPSKIQTCKNGLNIKCRLFNSHDEKYEQITNLCAVLRWNFAPSVFEVGNSYLTESWAVMLRNTCCKNVSRTMLLLENVIFINSAIFCLQNFQNKNRFQYLNSDD